MHKIRRFFPFTVLVFLLSCGQTGGPLPEDFSKPEIVEGVTNVSDPPMVQFFALGDWGSGSSDEKNVADSVAAFCSANPCDFGLFLGDNFYDTGVSSITDPQWKSKFEDVYSAPSLQLPFFAVLGNHDHDGNPQAEIDYTSQQDRWKMPASRYLIRYPDGSAGPLLEIFVIDTVYGAPLSQAELDSLSADLDASTAQWKILATHHPVYSNGSHGDTTGLDSTLIPVICNRVDMVLSGHDHLFSHLDDPNDGCRFQQWVVGTGGKSHYSAHSDPRVIFNDDSNFGFASLDVQSDGIQVNFHLTDGSIEDSFLLTKSP